MRIEPYKPQDQDDERIGNKLTQFTLDKGGPMYLPKRIAFRAVAHEQTMGELSATLLWGFMEVNLFHVEAAYRGRGVGKALIAAAEKYAHEHKVAGVTLWTPSFQGEGFYERCGYQEMERLPLNVPKHFGGRPVFYLRYAKLLPLGKELMAKAQGGKKASLKRKLVMRPTPGAKAAAPAPEQETAKRPQVMRAAAGSKTPGKRLKVMRRAAHTPR